MREKVQLEYSDKDGNRHFYTTTKNKRSTAGKLALKKYHPGLRAHVLYKETKLR